MINIQYKVSGLDELREGLIKLKSQYNDILEDQLFAIASEFLVPRIVLNTPIKTGRLRSRIFVRREAVRARGDSASVTIEADTPYALRIHEAEFELGPRSRAQPLQPEGGVGNKYIERVVYYHKDLIAAGIGQVNEIAIRKAFKSGRVRLIRRVEV